MKKKLNKDNLLMLITFVCSSLVVIADLLVIIINISKASWTEVGMLTFGISAVLSSMSFDYLKEQSTKKEK